MTVINTIKSKLKKAPMPFVEFMQHALYAPLEGYYSAGLQKFGEEGDFITAPELSPLFAETIANQVVQIFSQLNEPSLFEFGAGSGRLCVDLLKALEKLKNLPKTYYILEVSASLKARQQQLIEQEIPHLYERMIWLDQWPKEPIEGLMLANEVLDAMPIHRFLKTEKGLLESFVQLNEQEELEEVFKPIENPRLMAAIKNLGELKAPYLSEINLFIDEWLKECSNALKRGAFLIIDYGFPRHEYYHPDRNTGTLMCHYRHHSHPSPLLHVGEQDITAHVDFTHVAEAAVNAGFFVAGYSNQASFLLSAGLLSLIESLHDEKKRFIAQNKAKKLIQPQEMGELFKVIALLKGIDLPLIGFQLQDKRASL